MESMIAWQLTGPGPADSFERIERPIPEARPGHVLIRVRAFGLNRSELFSRRGMSSPDFTFPRVLGLECVGELLDPSDSGLPAGARVMAMMGGMGRHFDGSYATHTVVPRSSVVTIDTDLPWADLGALPETYNTATGVCLQFLALAKDDRVLIRGGTSALGLACADIARDVGCEVVATTRNREKAKKLEASGNQVVLEGPDFTERMLREFGPVTAVVECVGSKATLESSAACMPDGGRLGQVGLLAETWDTDGPPELPGNVEHVFWNSEDTMFPRDDDRLRGVVRKVEAGRYRVNTHRTFGFDEIAEAHRVMEANEAIGKLVVVTP